MLEFMDEIEAGHEFTHKVCDTTTALWLELYTAMTQVVEQYRREKLIMEFGKVPLETIHRLGVWEKHLHLKGPLADRLVELFENPEKYLLSS